MYSIYLKNISEHVHGGHRDPLGLFKVQGALLRIIMGQLSIHFSLQLQMRLKKLYNILGVQILRALKIL